jgi:acetyltransferase-like isoleucine patch superfamily enzyme
MLDQLKLMTIYESVPEQVSNPCVKIGQGCVIAAGSVVAKDAEAGMLVGLTGAKILKNG